MMSNVTTLTSVNKLEIVVLAVCHNTFSKPLDKGVLLEIYFLISQSKYISCGYSNNHLNEKVLLSYQNICLN